MVKVCALAACSLPGSVCLEWIALLWVGQNGLPPTPNTLYLGCSYHLHSSHRFLSTWGVVMLERKEKKKWHFRYCIFLCSTVFCIAFRRTVWIFLIIEDLKEEGCVLKNAFSRSVLKFYCFCLIKSCVSAKTSCKHIVVALVAYKLIIALGNVSCPVHLTTTIHYNNHQNICEGVITNTLQSCSKKLPWS